MDDKGIGYPGMQDIIPEETKLIENRMSYSKIEYAFVLRPPIPGRPLL